MNYLLINNNNSNWYNLVKSIIDNDSPFIQLIYNELSKMNESDIKSIYKNFFHYSPNILFKDISKKFIIYWKKKNMQKITIQKNMNINLIKEFIAWTIVVEVPVVNYINRINEYFNWEQIN
jgi:hypothetical protein